MAWVGKYAVSFCIALASAFIAIAVPDWAWLIGWIGGACSVGAMEIMDRRRLLT